jgi:Domain of unknown function (DUF4145)
MSPLTLRCSRCGTELEHAGAPCPVCTKRETAAPPCQDEPDATPRVRADPQAPRCAEGVVIRGTGCPLRSCAMKCPHCLESFHPEGRTWNINVDNEHMTIRLHQYICPACLRTVLELERFPLSGGSTLTLVYPRGIARVPLPAEVPEPYATDYREAAEVLDISPKASAAVSRRCLQHILVDHAGVKQGDALSKQIQAVLDNAALPGELLDAIDAIRNVGNFAAHPSKDQHTGEVVDVEPGEAEWLLDVLEELFDFYFVRPEVLRKKREALNQKLADIGKPPMKP